MGEKDPAQPPSPFAGDESLRTGTRWKPVAPSQGPTTLPEATFRGREGEGPHILGIRGVKVPLRIRAPAEMTAGRDPGNDLAIAGDPLVSRRHLVVRATAGGVTIEDLGSSTGTFLNNRPIFRDRRVPLGKGDRVRLGSVEIVLLYK